MLFKLNERLVRVLRDKAFTGMTVDRALVAKIMTILGSSGSLQMLDNK